MSRDAGEVLVVYLGGGDGGRGDDGRSAPPGSPQRCYQCSVAIDEETLVKT